MPNRRTEYANSLNALDIMQRVKNEKSPHDPLAALLNTPDAHTNPQFIPVVIALYEKIPHPQDLIFLMRIAIKHKLWDCLGQMIEKNANKKINYAEIILRVCNQPGAPFDLIELLLEKGAPLYVKAEDNKTCLHLAVEQKNHLAVAGLLAYARAISKKKDKKSNFPTEDILFNAIRNAPIDIIEALFLDAKEDALFGKLRSTYLHEAVRQNRADIIPLLIEKKVPCDKQELNLFRGLSKGTVGGETPLDLARRKRDLYPECYLALLRNFINTVESIENLSPFLASTVWNPIDKLSSLILLKNSSDEIDQFIIKIGGLYQEGIGLDSRWLHFILKSERGDIPDLLSLFITIHQVSCSTTDRQGITAAEYAASQGMADAFLALVEAVRGTNAQENGFDKALLTILNQPNIPQEKKIEVTFAVLALTNQEKSPQPIDTRKIFPAIAAMNNAEFINKFITLKYKIDLKIIDKTHGYTILEQACISEHWSAVEAIGQRLTIEDPTLLQTHGLFHRRIKTVAAPDIARILQRTIWRAIQKNAPLTTINVLREAGADNHLRHMVGLYHVVDQNTMSHHIIQHNREDLLEIIAKFCTIDLIFENSQGKTPVDLAIELANKDNNWSLIEKLMPMLMPENRQLFLDSAKKHDQKALQEFNKGKISHYELTQDKIKQIISNSPMFIPKEEVDKLVKQHQLHQDPTYFDL